MRRLVDGAYAVVGMPPRGSEVSSTLHPRTAQLGPEHHDELVALCHGVEDRRPPGPAFALLSSLGLAESKLAADDAVVMARLAALGHGYAWHIRGDAEAETRVELLRRFHSRRKLSNFEFGQTAVLPECGVARCHELTRRAGTGLRVLVIGDDDLLAPILAHMGHTVTVLDIDPALVALLQRCAKDAGVKVDARVQDIVQPLPRDLRGAFDAVLTDPMSYEACFDAFLARAVHALKPGGSILCCVHPLGRNTFEKVARRLPLHLQDVMLEMSVYYYQGFVENWYRSDMVHLLKTSAAVPYAADQPLPYTDIISGTLADRLHAFTDVLSQPLRKASVADMDHALAALEHWAGADAFVSSHAYETERYAHRVRLLARGGHVAMVLDKLKGVLSWDAFPYDPAWDQALVGALAGRLRLGGIMHFSAAPPDLNAPVMVANPAPAAPGGKRPAPRKAAGARKRRLR